MRFLIADTYYDAFLSSLYAGHLNLAQQSYTEQWRFLMDQCFGTSDFYSANLAALGHEATEVIANCEPLQRQWAKENGLAIEESRVEWNWVRRKKVIPWLRRSINTDWIYTVLRSQVEQYHPDVLYVQDMNSVSPTFLREVRPYVRLIVGQTAYPLTLGVGFEEYDLILSSFPHYVEKFQREGLNSEYFNLAFEPRLLGQLKKGEHHPVVFVGGLSTSHMERIQILEAIAAAQPIDLWGYGVDSLHHNSPLRKAHHGNAWALDMYQVLYNADMALNHHINVAGAYANNMRLYEATGVGTLLVTDYKENLHTLFEPGKEIIAYRSAEECVELINYCLTHKEERRAIARAGQARALREHTYYHRMQELLGILKRYL